MYKTNTKMKLVRQYNSFLSEFDFVMTKEEET